jgi:transglutaminase-like putative cysteine protease
MSEVSYRVRHSTRYRYGQPVTLSYHLAHLLPRNTDTQWVSAYRLEVSPPPASRREDVDYFGNPFVYFAYETPHNELTVETDLKITVTPRPAVAPEVTSDWLALVRMLAAPTGADIEASEFSYDSALITSAPIFAEFARPSFPPGRPVLAGGIDLMKRIHRDFTFDATATDIATPLDEVMREKRGVCQDFAHLFIVAIRSLGLSARYVSGYIRTSPPPGKARLQGADASHAWTSLYCGDAGWIDLDPTNNLIVGTDHVTLAWGRDFDDVSPLRGVLTGGNPQVLKVGVDMEPLEKEGGSPLATGPHLPSSKAMRTS